MVGKINGEEQFQVLAHSFTCSPSESGYTLAYSADGKNFTNYTSETPANETLIVFGCAYGQYFKLVGNTSLITFRY